MCKSFYQPVNHHLGSQIELEINPSRSHFVTDMVLLNVNVFGSNMVGKVVIKSEKVFVVKF